MIKSVRIMGGDWRIVVDPDLPADAHAVAQTHPRTHQIVMDPGRHPVGQGQSLLHEILEVLMTMLPLDLEHDKLEMISHSLFAVLRDNPEVARHIVAGRRIVPKP